MYLIFKSVVATLVILLYSSTSISNTKVDKATWLGKFLGSDIVIDNPFGDVRIRYGGDDNAVEYIAIIQNIDNSPSISVLREEKNGQLIVKAIRTSSQSNDTNNKSRIDFTLFIPKGKHIYVNTNLGLIDAKGIIANIDASSEGGMIVLNKVKGAVNTNNNYGKTQITLTQLKSKEIQNISSITGSIDVWVSRKSDFLIEISTSSDLTTDFTLKLKNHFNLEPSKTAKIKLNKHNSKIKVKSKRGNIAIRGFGEF